MPEIMKGAIPKIIIVVGLFISLNQCGVICLAGICLVDDFEVSERAYDRSNLKFRIAGEFDGEEISLTFKLDDKEVLKNLSFGSSDAEAFAKYGALKKIDTLNSKALQTYRNDYLIPGKACPAWFMNKNLESVVLIGANDQVADELEGYDIPFDGRGTEFELIGHYMDHLENRYIENGEHINLTITEHTSIASNVGSAKRKVSYFLVTDIAY